MQSEYQILAHLARTDQTSQRKIAMGNGLSVGTVNLLLKKMVRKGLVKLERINGRTLRYVLTPQGMAEKTRLACQYLKVSYQRIVRVNQALERAVSREALVSGRAPRVVFYGPRDEILEMLRLAARSLELDCTTATTPEELAARLGRANAGEHQLVVFWDAGKAREIPADLPRLNILEAI